MLTLITLFLGIILGLILTFLSLWIIKIKCSQCQQLKPVSQIIVFNFKNLTITGQPCFKCRQVKSSYERTN